MTDLLCSGLSRQDTSARNKKPARLVGSQVGSALLESNGCRYDPLTRTPTPLQQQQQQEMEFVLGVIVMANLVFLQLVPAPHPEELA
jgi:hypothetical protein